MNVGHILADADNLRSKSPIIRIVSENVEALLLRINSDILDAMELQKDIIVFKLPINFDLQRAQVNNRDVQIQVYYTIIEELEKKNYKIGLKMDNKSSLLYISWQKTIDNKNIRNMEKKLNQYQIKK